MISSYPATTSTSSSLYLLGPFAPVPDETEAADLSVRGSIPPELTGRYLRNGPNPLPGEDPQHWFLGHGMLHGIALQDGKARWYRNRWVRTAKLAGEPFLTDRGPDLAVSPANTHIVEHGGTLLALCESGLPYEITPELDTVGPYDFGGRLTTAMTAHPKTDPATGELYFFGYSAMAPYVTFHVADASGQLVRSTPVEVPGPTMMHDFAITEHYVLWLDLPVVFDHSALTRGGMPYVWNDRYGARIGVMAKTGGPVRWIEIDPCYVFHVGNAAECVGSDGRSRIVLDAVRYAPETFTALWSGIGPSSHPSGSNGGALVDRAARAGVSRLHRWVLDPVSRTATETPLDDREMEFPSLNDAVVGRPNRYLYTVGNAVGSRMIKFDLHAQSSTTYEFDRPTQVGEAVFVPAAAHATEEDAGWLLSIITPRDGSASELLIMDAADITADPVARIQLPRRVPAGFHGSWIPEDPAEDSGR